ncbi:MAG: hypothetical protein ACQKBU_05200, partial [Verrucomicrobiales bacterium]
AQILARHRRLLAGAKQLGLLDDPCRRTVETETVTIWANDHAATDNRVTAFTDLVSTWIGGNLSRLFLAGRMIWRI